MGVLCEYGEQHPRGTRAAGATRPELGPGASELKQVQETRRPSAVPPSRSAGREAVDPAV